MAFYSLARRGRCVSVARLPTMANGTTENTHKRVASSSTTNKKVLRFGSVTPTVASRTARVSVLL
ncbi:UNVERIFIED_CONTAM: hypothetical protein FKN15_000490 [Acipenser sinensis]